MAQTYVYKNGTGNVATTFPFTFPYIKEADVKVEVKESGAWITKTKDTHYEFSNATTLKFLSGQVPVSGTNNIKISRSTDADKLTATFYPGSAIRSVDLNDNFTQNLYSTEEAKEKSDQAFQTDGSSVMTGDIVFEGATANDYETTLAITDPTADRTITLPNVTGTVVTTGDTGSVTSTMITDGTIVNADINASAAIAGSKLAAATTSAPGSMSAADKTKLDGIETAATADQTNAEIRAAVEAASDSNVFTDADHSKLNAIEASATADQTAAEIRTLVESASDSNVFTDADHTKLNGIETSATADQTVTEIKSLLASDNLTSSHLAANSVTTSEITDLNVTTAKIAADAVTAAKIADDVVNSEHYAAASIDTEHIADSNITTVKIADVNVTTGKIADNAVTIAKVGCEQTTITDSDSHVPTSGAVVDYVAGQLAPIGGFTAIATEVAFPATASQPANGVIMSISDAQGVVINGSGVSTTGRTTDGTPATVTINGFPSSLYGETLALGVGLMVSSTGSSNTYTYHKLLAAEGDVKQLSDDINDFNARYRVNAGEPGSANDEGDLCYDTSANKMKVYDGSAWGEVTSTGDYKYLFLCPAGGTGAPTINGSIATYDLRESSNSGSAASVTKAAQLMVSVNGVMQKPNTGTSAPAEGFALVDTNTIIFGANLPTGAEVFITQVGTATTLATPADNSVTTAKIASAAVTTAKIADDAVDGAKLANNIDIAGTLDVTGEAVFDDKVGIGTASPSTNLCVYDASSAGFRLETPGIKAIAHTWDGTDYTISNNDGNAGHPIIFGTKTAGAESMRIDSSGNVLVGLTTSVGIAGTPADLNSTEVGKGYINISRDDTAAADHILFGKNGSVASSIGTSTTNSLTFKTGTTERMRITSDGKITIGDSSPIGAFQVKSTEATKAFFRHADSNQTTLAISTSDTNATIESTHQAGGSGAYKPLAFKTGGADRLTISAAGITTSTGNLTTNAKLSVNGAGVIGDTANAIELWDDAATTKTFTVTGGGAAEFAGSVTDSKGNVRSIPQNTQGSAYTLVAADAGKHILASGAVTIPNSVFSAGDAVTIVNNTAGNLTLTAATGLTLYNTADGSNGNLTLATRGMATVLFASGSASYISGAGLS